MELLTLKQHKTDKNQASGYYTASLNLQPNYPLKPVLVGRMNCAIRNTCPFGGKCKKFGCLDERGMNNLPTHKAARIERTKFLAENPKMFLAILTAELWKAVKASEKRKLQIACRLNCLSDLPWEIIFPELFIDFPMIQFYDYTKDISRIRAGLLPHNYFLTYSINELSKPWDIGQAIQEGYNCAAIFLEPEKYYELFGLPLIDGESDDIRWNNPGVIYKLKYKKPFKLPMPSRKQLSGFCVDVTS